MFHLKNQAFLKCQDLDRMIPRARMVEQTSRVKALAVGGFLECKKQSKLFRVHQNSLAR